MIRFSRAEDAWFTRLDADGNPVGDRIPFNDFSLSTVEMDEITPVMWPVQRTIDISADIHNDLIRTLMGTTLMGTWKLDDMERDMHPDPLIVSDAYPDFVAGWYVLDVVGNIKDNGPHGPHESLYLLVRTAQEDHIGPAHRRECYHHPSREYLSEIARQIITRERRVFKHAPGTTDTWTYGTPDVVQLSRVIQDHRGNRLESVAYCTCALAYPMCTFDDLMNPPDPRTLREAVWCEGSYAHAWGYSM